MNLRKCWRIREKYVDGGILKGIRAVMKETGAAMTEQEKEIVAKASVPMTIANGFRWFFMIIALLIVLVLFFGNKIWDEAVWYEAFSGKAYAFLLWDIALMLVCSILRVAFTARYNRIVKNL